MFQDGACSPDQAKNKWHQRCLENLCGDFKTFAMFAIKSNGHQRCLENLCGDFKTVAMFARMNRHQRCLENLCGDFKTVAMFALKAMGISGV